ncbi:MAG TPA: polymorphic toxin-type HINT domain-containing protein [Chitinophagaceae bacterium]
MSLLRLSRRTVILLLILIGFCGTSFAGIEPYQNAIKGTLKKGDSLIVKDEKFRSVLFDWKEITNRDVKNYIVLELRQDTSYQIRKAFNYEVELKLEYFSDPEQTEPLSIDTVKLRINYSPDTGVSYKAKDVFSFSNGYWVKVTIKEVTCKEIGDELPPVIQLSNQILIDRKYQFKPELQIQYSGTIDPGLAKNGIEGSAEKFGNGSLSTHHLALTWTPISGAEEYDIEWTFMELGTEKDPIIQQVLANAFVGNLDLLFRNNCTRITTSGNTYDVSMVFNSKYLMLRMRQVHYLNGIRIEGNWDYKKDDNTYAIWDISTYWHESNLNWMYNAVFSEEGKKKESIQYFDGTLRGRQTVSISKSDFISLTEKAVIEEIIYDEFGRAAGKVLPAIYNEPNLHYYRNVNMNQANTASYDFRNIRGTVGGNCENQPEALGNQSGAAKYFSPGNPFKTDALYNRYIPDANGYPITVKQFVKDNTGRVRLQGDVGSMFQPGNSNSKTTKFYYGKPEPWELDRVFGNDVGFADRYIKNMVIDANGQISVNYTDGQGRTIASALTGANSPNADPLAGLPNKTIRTIPVLQPRQFKFDASALTLKATSTYLASIKGDVSIAYDVQKLVYTYQGSNFQICSNCYYDLTVTVKNDCNVPVYTTTIPVQIGSQQSDCGNTGLQQGNLTVNFPEVGEYYITFEFALSKNVIESYTESYIQTRQQNGSLLTEFDFVLQYLQATDFMGCFSECRTCETALGSSADFMQAIKGKLTEYGSGFAGREAELDAWINGLYNTLRAHCLALKADCMLSPCARFEKQMLDDVSPGGQYSLFDLNPFIPLEQEINVLFKYWRVEFPVLSPGNPTYDAELITLADGTETSPYDASFTLEMLVQFWDEEWAQKFLKYHPEKCKLDFCNNYSSYIKWDDQVTEFIKKASDIPNIPGSTGLTYQPGVPAWLLPADPFFKPGNPGNAYYSEMQADLQQFSTRIMKITEPAANVKGLTHVVDYLLYCIDPDGNTNSGTGNSWNNCSPVASCRVPDKEWNSYKEFYFQLKEKYYIQARNNGECANACQVGTPYVMPGNCPTPKDFFVEAVIVDPQATPPCPGQKQIRLSHGRGAVRRATTVILYYPSEYNSLGLTTTFNFAIGESEKLFCVPLNVNVGSIKVKTVTCSGSASSTGSCAFGTGGQLNLLPGAQQLSGNKFQETNTTTGMLVTYTIVQGQLNQPPNGSIYCTNGTVSMQFYNCYKVYMPGSAIPIQYFNVWVITCSQDQCANAYVVNGMEMQMGQYKFYANGRYYYIRLSNGGGATPECSGYPAPVYYPCLKVYVNGNSTPFSFYNAGITDCNTCSAGENIIIPDFQLGTNEFQMSDGGIYVVYPNTQPGYYPSTGYCTNPTRDWFPCFKVTLYGVTTVYYNATVLYCPPSTGGCDWPMEYYVSYQAGVDHFVWQNGSYTEDYYVIGGDPCCPPDPYWYCYGKNSYLDWADCVVFYVNGVPSQTYTNVWIVICTSYGYCEYCKQPFTPEKALAANLPIGANAVAEWKKLKDETAKIAKSGKKQARLLAGYTDNAIYLVLKATPTEIKDWETKGNKLTSPRSNPGFAQFEFSRAFSLRTGDSSFVHLRNVWVARFRPVPAQKTSKPALIKGKLISRSTDKSGAMLPPIECDTEFEMTYYSYGCDYNYQGAYYQVRPANQVSLCEGQSANVNILLYGDEGTYLYTTLYFDYGNDVQYVCIDQNTLDRFPTVAACGLIDGECAPPPNPCPDIFKDKKSRFPEVSFNFGVTTQEMQDMNDENSALLLSQIQTNCESHATQWMQDLAECLTPYSQATKDLLKARLIEVCMKGGDIDHPYGASTTRPGEVTASNLSSFKQAIMTVLGLSQLSMTCNPWLLDEPHPYAPKQQSVEKMIASTDANLCVKLQQIRTQHQNEQPGISLHQYLVNKYGNAMNLTLAQLNMILKSCDNCRYLLEEDMPLPVFLEPGATGCITKNEFDAAKAALASEMGGTLSTTHANYEDVLSNYLNHRWGFSMAYHRYLAYETELATNPLAILCNQPPFVSVEVDPYACLKDLVASAIISGRREYEAYIIEEKRKFRVNYVNACSKAKANARLTAEQQIYHYTLYYYDQAGNLVRTVPPEGVNFLTDAEMNKVTAAREFTSADCTYNGPLGNTDKNFALQQLSNAFSFNGNRAIEMWIYKNASTSSQTLAVTPDNLYMFHTCLSGNKLTTDIYAVTQPAPGNYVFTLSNHISVDVSSLQPLHPWLHVVVQGSQLSTAALQIYVNGTAVPVLAGNPPADCSWSVIPGNPLPENLANLKHLRIYQRQLTVAEISANAGEACLVINPAYQPGLNPQLLHWARFNTPAAGDPTTIASNSTVETQYVPVYPLHSLATTYAYNSTDQAVQAKSPDGGTTYFWYDRLGRMIASQNEEQRSPHNNVNPGRFSYNKYDTESRRTEAGEKLNYTAGMPSPGFLETAKINDFYSNGNNIQITETVYDKLPAAAPGVQTGLFQENLRKRISAAFLRENAGGPVVHAAYYSYDISGNAKTVWQQVQGIGLKKLEYEFDLASGKTSFVRYQDGANDQFYYAYEYDADNKLINAYTGTQVVGRKTIPTAYKQLDANFSYYLHGPLARTELGNSQVQGLDYAYTLQGWPKALNGSQLNITTEIGQDGNAGSGHGNFSKDVLAYTIGYYQGDYQPIDGVPAVSMNYIPQAGDVSGHNLYNGNISNITLAINKFRNSDPVGYTYKYDQLSRLKEFRMHNLTSTTTNWNGPSHTQSYRESITYDANGNINTYVRNGEGVASRPFEMDDLNYVYPTATDPVTGRVYKISNRLRHINDNPGYDGNYSTAVNQTEDLDNQPNDNYLYDKLGNLVKDFKENLDEIRWNAYGKISQIRKTNAVTGVITTTDYFYDPAGNRVKKILTVGSDPTTTWYIRDAQGNSIAVYSDKHNGTSGMWWKEQHMYSSRRLGMWTPNIDVNSQNGTNVWGVIGNKQYELVNHLGTVMMVISDKKISGEAEVIAANDYYPFGMLMPGRTYQPGNYRYGFNGKEEDNEIKGEGNQIDYGLRVYDPRVARFMSVDPKAQSFSWLTPYQYAANNPIAFIDLEGAEPSKWLDDYLGIKLEPTTAGFIDGMYDGIGLGTFEMLWDFAFDKSFRNELIDAFKMAASDPIGFAKMIADDYRQKAKNIMAGNEQGRYELGYIGGEFIGGMLGGGALNKFLGYAKKFPAWKRMQNLLAKIPILNKLTSNPCGCLTEDTKVLTPDGYRFIKDLKDGDLVLSYNDTLRIYQAKKIHDRYRLVADTIYHIGLKGETIKTTFDHPFLTQRGWVNARDLNAADSLLTNESAYLPIASIQKRVQSVNVYNFEVTGFHTYIIGNNKIVVHNSIGPGCKIREYGFYRIATKDGQLYIGKGPLKRAQKSLSDKTKKAEGDGEWWRVDKPIGGLTLEQTSFVYEYIMIQRALDKGMSFDKELLNKIHSPGKKIFSGLSEDLKKKVTEVYEQTIGKTATAVPPKQR